MVRYSFQNRRWIRQSIRKIDRSIPIIDRSTTKNRSSDHVILWLPIGISLVSRPHPQMGKGLVTFERFLVVLSQQNARDYIQYSTSYAICVPCVCHMTADTAQPRKRSNVTRPFPICGWGLGTRLAMDPPIDQKIDRSIQKNRNRATTRKCWRGRNGYFF